ncbi:hypothetical protein C9994_03855 [Marivirga lumbricoides]|uniref:Uncharacterized protein n=1 Tax=Marivirga lumbricoides TaxID=1046115 RepID=A0A2T4DTN1_9BACT|nr:hypothetical protein C9994_03855 [Marivirga lumbricoides]
MKNWKYIIRVIGILTVGLLLVKMTYQFKYSTFMFDLIFFGGLTIIGLVFLIWSLFTDLKHFRTEKKIILLIPIGLAIIFTTTIWVWNVRINSNFDKPTLVRIFYDGDFNGTGIDFKTDGTYIFDNSAIGLSDFIYGTYEINGNRIILDKKTLDNVVVTNQLEIRPKLIEYSDRTETEKYVFQIDENGNLIEKSTEFRLVVDNRK